VRIFGRLRKALAADSMELQASTVAEALLLLRARLDLHDAQAQAMLDQAVVLVNGRNIRSLRGDETALGADDEMTVLQQVAGG
jgi:molybdopterin converting factor small subunit